MRSHVFRDFDAFAESVRDVDCKMMLRNPNRRVWSVSSVDLGRIDIQLGRLGSGNIAQGQLRSDGFMLYLPLTDAVEYTANGEVLRPRSFALLEPGCEFCISTKDDHDWCVAFVPTDLIDLGGFSSRSCRVTRPNALAADAFRATLLGSFTAAANCSHFASSPAATRAAEEVLRIANSIVGPQRVIEPIHDGRPKVPREEVIRLSMKFLEQQAGKLVKVEELAAFASVSERTLRTVFNEYFGLGPTRYLQLRRLYLVHRALKAADPEEVTVSQILVAHGEWAFSRFASRYRQLFDELPSETLRRRPA